MRTHDGLLLKPRELTICGLTAVKARFQHNAASILRLYFDRETGRKLGVMCKALAAARKVYRCVEVAELAKIAGSVHHGGVIAVVLAPALSAPSETELRSWAAKRLPVLILDRIGNAHNLGALARTAAFFGVPHLVIADDPAAARPNDAAYRVAEGGLESMTTWMVRDLTAFARQMAVAGYDVVGAATRGGRPEAGRVGTKPVALVMGNEEHGLAPDLTKACTRLVTIPGAGAVESLNVSVAGAVLMWELIGRRG